MSYDQEQDEDAYIAERDGAYEYIEFAKKRGQEMERKTDMMFRGAVIILAGAAAMAAIVVWLWWRSAL